MGACDGMTPLTSILRMQCVIFESRVEKGADTGKVRKC